MVRQRLAAVVAAFLFSLPAFAAITGAVMTSDGQPVAGAKVGIFAIENPVARRERLVSKSPQQTALASATTDSKGKFTLESPKDPVVQLRVEASGYAPDSARIERDEQVGTIVLTPVPMTTGTVTAAGKPVAGANVVWSGPMGEMVAVSDGQGRYSLPDPTKWATRAITIHPDFAIETETGGKLTADRKLNAGVSVAGRVTKRDETPVTDATIVVDGWPVAKSGADGSFTVAHAPKQWETIDAVTPALFGTMGRRAKANVIRMEAASTVSGSLRDNAQQPIAGAEIRLTPGARGMAFDAVAAAVTDAKGSYTITGMRPGSFQVVGSHPAFNVTGASAAITAGAKLSRPLTAMPLSRVTGTVLDEDKRPVAAAQLRVQPLSRPDMFMMIGAMEQARRVFSAPDGTYTMRTSTEGDVQMAADKKGWPVAKSTAFRLAAGDRKSGVLITIPHGVVVTGKVVDKDGRAVSGASVVPAESQGGMGGRVVRILGGMPLGVMSDPVRTASDGTFSLRLKEGTYDIVVRREGFSAKTLRGQQVNSSAKALDVTLDPAVEITGRIVRGGTPVDSVNISAMSESPTFTTSGPDGSFTISDLTPGPVMVNLRKSDGSVDDMRTLNAPAKDVVIEVPQGGTIIARVLDKSSRRPITTFEAGLGRTRGGGGMVFNMMAALRPFTSDDGTLVMENVPPGTVQLTVGAPGYTTTQVPNINVEAGKTVSDLEVLLDSGVKVTGRVTTSSGTGLSGVGIRQQTSERMGPMMSNLAVTDANGEYTIDAMEPGERTLTFTRDGYLTEQKTVTLSGREARVDAQLSTGQRITGTVVNEGGSPVAEAEVRASSAAMGGFGKMTKSDGSGTFSFDGLAPGHYRFTASKSGLADGVAEDVDISGGVPVRLVMKTGAVIFGRVTGLSDSELQGATVQAYTTGARAEAAVDANGNYRIEGAPSGSVRVSAMVARSFAERRTSQLKTVDLAAGGSVQVDIDFPNQTAVRGRITRNGAPLTNANVNFNPRGGTTTSSASATTDQSGNYTVTGLTDGSYNVVVMDMSRLAPYSTTYDVKGSGTFNIDMTGAKVRGTVTSGETGEPIANARVDLRPSAASGPAFGPGGGTNTAGEFIIEDVPAGSYSAVIQKDGYATVTRPNVVITESGTPDLDIKMSKNEGVTIRVIDARDQRLLDANVIVLDANNQPIQDTMFRFDSTPSGIKLSLGPGTYRAVVMANGYASQNVTITSPSKPTVALTPGGTVLVQQKDGGTRRVRMFDASGMPYGRSVFSRDNSFVVAGSSTTLQNVAPGRYRIQVLNEAGAPVSSVDVVVAEGRTVPVDI